MSKITLTSEEAIRVLLKVQERFNEWADDSIDGYRSLPMALYSTRLAGQIDALRFAKANLQRVIRAISTGE